MLYPFSRQSPVPGQGSESISVHVKEPLHIHDDCVSLPPAYVVRREVVFSVCLSVQWGGGYPGSLVPGPGRRGGGYSSQILYFLSGSPDTKCARFSGYCYVYTLTFSGVKMVIKIDMLKFTTQDTYYMDYFVSSCLRDMTPLTIEVSSILIRCVQITTGSFILERKRRHLEGTHRFSSWYIYIG